jgi:hypothetical protein
VNDDDTPTTKRDLAESAPTSEVGDEGGTPGDVELRTTHEVAAGSEADESWRPAERDEHVMPHDETGVGRRNP